MCAHKPFLTIPTLPTLPTLLTMSATFYLNRAQDKIRFDKIVIRKSIDGEDKFSVTYISDVTKDTLADAASYKFSIADSHALLDYMEEILDLLIQDKDTPPFCSMDVMLPGYPVVALKAGADDSLLLRVLRSWSKRA
jgi:hypothetical protein